jgi:hypothetical protein
LLSHRPLGEAGPVIPLVAGCLRTGDGGEFAWIIPTPEPPLVDDIFEPGEEIRDAVAILHAATQPARSVGWRYAGFLSWLHRGEESSAVEPVTVFGTAALRHYDIAIVGSEDPNTLVSWLQDNGFSVPNDAHDALRYYTEQNWAFVAARLRPSEDRRYDNELLAPLTIRYRSDQFAFPLLISSVSTVEAARVTLYVIADSTVASENFETVPMRFQGDVDWNDELGHVETTIKRLTGEEGHRLVVAYSNTLPWEFSHARAFWPAMASALMRRPFAPSTPVFVTRLEGLFQPAAMTEDIRLSLDPDPSYFHSLLTDEGTRGLVFGIATGPGWIHETGSASREFCLTTRLAIAHHFEYWFLGRWFPLAYGIDLLWSHAWADSGRDQLGSGLTAGSGIPSIGLSALWDLTADEPLPLIGFRFRLLDILPIDWFGIDLLSLAVYLNLNSRRVQLSWGIASLGLGFPLWFPSQWWEL